MASGGEFLAGAMACEENNLIRTRGKLDKTGMRSTQSEGLLSLISILHVTWRPQWSSGTHEIMKYRGRWDGSPALYQTEGYDERLFPAACDAAGRSSPGRPLVVGEEADQLSQTGSKWLAVLGVAQLAT